MGQHRTREQKERTAQRRLEQPALAYSLKDLSKDVTSPALSTKQQADQKEYAAYFGHDMLKTFLVCLVIGGIIATLWIVEKNGLKFTPPTFPLLK